MELLSGVLIWVLPPLLGAIIGYVTNAIAIRMLFRPLTEKRIFGLRVPLTPGLIPRERGDLAESMARMVSTELLTEEAVRRQIHAPSFQDSVRDNIRAVTSELLEMPLERVSGGFGDGDAAALEVGEGEPEGAGLLSSVSRLLASAFAGFTRSESFASLAKDLIRYLVNELSERPVSAFLGENRAVDDLVSGVLSGLTSDRGRNGIRERVAGWVKQQFEQNIAMSRFLSEEDVESLTRFVDSVYPSLIHFLVKWLRSEGTRRELTIRGRFLVQDIVDRLNGFQRFIITAAQYQRTLDENMGGIVDDAIASIEDAGMDPTSRRRIVEVVGRELGSIRARGLADVAKKQEEAIERGAATLAERAVGVLSGPDFRKGLIETLSGTEEGKSQTVGSLFDRFLGLEGKDLGEFVVGLIFPQRSEGEAGEVDLRRGIGEALSGFFRRFVESHRQMRIRELLGMDDSMKERFDAALTTTLIATVDARVPEILRSIDIHDLVVSKINGLNIEEVESLLLRVIEKHLRWINVFGAMLGALIGLIQDLLRVLNLSG